MSERAIVSENRRQDTKTPLQADEYPLSHQNMHMDNIPGFRTPRDSRQTSKSTFSFFPCWIVSYDPDTSTRLSAPVQSKYIRVCKILVMK